MSVWCVTYLTINDISSQENKFEWVWPFNCCQGAGVCGVQSTLVEKWLCKGKWRQRYLFYWYTLQKWSAWPHLLLCSVGLLVSVVGGCSEKDLVHDRYLIPYATVELAILYLQQERLKDVKLYLHRARYVTVTSASAICLLSLFSSWFPSPFFPCTWVQQVQKLRSPLLRSQKYWKFLLLNLS